VCDACICLGGEGGCESPANSCIFSRLAGTAERLPVCDPSLSLTLVFSLSLSLTHPHSHLIHSSHSLLGPPHIHTPSAPEKQNLGLFLRQVPDFVFLTKKKLNFSALVSFDPKIILAARHHYCRVSLLQCTVPGTSILFPAE
jgi:hypothetical protein